MRLLSLMLGVALLAACAGKPRVEPATLKKIANAEVQVTRNWRRDIGDLDTAHALRPLVAGGRVFSADAEGRVLALESDGRELWRIDLDRRLGAGPALVDGQLIVGTRNGDVLALSALEGALNWERRLSSEVATLPAGNQRILVVKTEDGRVHGLAPATGEVRWVVPMSVPALTWRGNAPLVVTDEAVLVGTSTGRLRALAINDGSTLWEELIAEPRGRSEVERLVDVDADLLVAPPVVVGLSTGGNLKVLRLSTGQPLWERALGSFVGGAFDETCLYVVDREDTVYCLEPRTGAARWTQDQLSYRRLTRPQAYKGNLLVADMAGYVHVLSTANGSIIGRGRLGSDRILWLGDGPESAPLALAQDGGVYQFDVVPRTVAE